MILWIIGILGFGMRVLDVPVAPCVVGLILGPLAEQQFRRALSISQGDVSVFFTHPISLLLLSIAVLLVITPILLRRRQRQVEAEPGRGRTNTWGYRHARILDQPRHADRARGGPEHRQPVVIAVLVGKLPKERQARRATPA